MYFDDAANWTLSPHGRYSAAMSALQALCAAGIGDDHDLSLVDFWEARRYDPQRWPSRHELAVVLVHVAALLEAQGAIRAYEGWRLSNDE